MVSKVPGEYVDPHLYLDPPILDAAGLLSLAKAMLDCAPMTPVGSLLGVLRRFRKACDDLQSIGRMAGPAGGLAGAKENRPPAEAALESAWTAFYERLRAYLMLPDGEYPRVRRALECMRLLFPDAIGFLSLPLEEQCAECDKRLHRIIEYHLDADLHQIVGSEFLNEIRRTHAAGARALGRQSSPGVATVALLSGLDMEPGYEAATGNESTAVRVLRHNLGRCISQYALKILSLGAQEVDPKDCRRWLAPLAAYQRVESRRLAGSSGSAIHAPSGAGSSSSSAERRRLQGLGSSPDNLPYDSSDSAWISSARTLQAATSSSEGHRPITNQSSGDRAPVRAAGASSGLHRSVSPAHPPGSHIPKEKSGSLRDSDLARSPSGLYRPIASSFGPGASSRAEKSSGKHAILRSASALDASLTAASESGRSLLPGPVQRAFADAVTTGKSPAPPVPDVGTKREAFERLLRRDPGGRAEFPRPSEVLRAELASADPPGQRPANRQSGATAGLFRAVSLPEKSERPALTDAFSEGHTKPARPTLPPLSTRPSELIERPSVTADPKLSRSPSHSGTFAPVRPPSLGKDR